MFYDTRHPHYAPGEEASGAALSADASGSMLAWQVSRRNIPPNGTGNIFPTRRSDSDRRQSIRLPGPVGILRAQWLPGRFLMAAVRETSSARDGSDAADHGSSITCPP